MILTYDIGTTVMKGAALEEGGTFLKLATRQLLMKKGEIPGWFEADPTQWISAFREITEELLSQNRQNAEAVVISGNGPTLVPVAQNGQFLDPVMSWLDRRGVEESRLIREASGDYIDPSFYLPKAYWIYRNRPEIYERAAFFLSCPESIVYKLTGNAITILPGANFEPWYWSDSQISSIGLDREKFPGFRKPGTIVGRVGKTGAEISGLSEGVPVIAAGPDFVVTLLGSGSVRPGDACDRAGTSEGINLCTDHHITDRRLMCYGHVVEPWYNVSGIISTSGRALEWIKSVAGRDEIGYRRFLESLKEVRPGAGGLLFLPYLNGERAPHWDPDARGSFIGLGLNHTMEDMVTAVLESIGFAMRDVMEVMAESGGEIDLLRITGSPSKSDIWNQIKADITGKRMLVPEVPETELIGNLLLGLKALGKSGSLAESADRIVRSKREFVPREEFRGLYDDLFGLYRESYGSLKDIFTSLARLR